MNRGLTIDDKHTFYDWGLILTSNPTASIGTPKPKTNYIDIPSGDGSIDLTEALTGEVKYEDRKGSFEFDVLEPWKDWPKLISEISSYLHGQKRKIILPDEPNFYYCGRLEVNAFKTDKRVGTLTIDTITEPYKLKVHPTIYDLTIGSTGRMDVTCTNSRKRVVPTITTDRPITIEFGGSSRTISAGSYKITNIVLTEGKNQLAIIGSNGTKVKIEYVEGAL